ncbi:tetratricopeptide repeat protein [Wenxinia marina]|nr:tetratricopeptide repeat protein [Wenxinia marina]
MERGSMAAAMRAAMAALLLGTPLAAQDSGSYLAGRQAGLVNDYAAGVEFFTRALQADPANAALLQYTIAAHVGLGQPLDAAPYAAALADGGVESTMSALVLQAQRFEDGDWDGILSALQTGQTVSPLVDGLARGWAHVGEGDMGAALAAFDEMIESEGLRPFGAFHKALALAAAGDFEAAEPLLAQDRSGGLERTRRGVVAHALILGQLGRGEEGAALIDATFGARPEPDLAELRDRLRAGEAVPYDVAADATEGMAEVYFDVASILTNEASPSVTLIYARLAEALDPSLVQATLMSAALLDKLEQYGLAVRTYGTVPQDSPFFHAAEMGRADALYSAGQPDAAVEVLRQLTRSHGEMPVVQAAFADMLRRTGAYGEAEAAYTRAIDLSDPEDQGLWLIHYTRGIARHRIDRWDGAESDFRAALDIDPDQPQVLNYLGYSLVERGEKLDEALAMIEAAAERQPENGSIVDSLGWAHFTLGDYGRAVEEMERAAELEPVDAVVNDHLGDAYWAVGREREARFQWQRALSFGPEPDAAQRIRRKLQVGLDVVLVEENRDPLDLAQGG